MARVGQAQERTRRTPRRDEPKQARSGPVDNRKVLAGVPRKKLQLNRLTLLTTNQNCAILRYNLTTKRKEKKTLWLEQQKPLSPLTGTTK